MPWRGWLGSWHKPGSTSTAAAVAARAEDVARSITGPDPQAHALARVAEAFARAGEIRSASCVAAAACALGGWTIAVKPVLMLAPSASEILTRALEEQ
jgi:hypothetical protein